MGNFKMEMKTQQEHTTRVTGEIPFHHRIWEKKAAEIGIHIILQYLKPVIQSSYSNHFI